MNLFVMYFFVPCLLESSPFPHTLILCNIFFLPFAAWSSAPTERENGRRVTNDHLGYGKAESGWSEKKLKFYENSQNQPSSRIQMMFGDSYEKMERMKRTSQSQLRIV